MNASGASRFARWPAFGITSSLLPSARKAFRAAANTGKVTIPVPPELAAK